MLQNCLRLLLRFVPPRLLKRALEALPPGLQARLRARARGALARMQGGLAPARGALVAGAGTIRAEGLDDALAAGVNIVGYARASTGLGELARSAVGALRAAGVAQGMQDYGARHSQAQDEALSAPRTEGFAHRANLFCLNTDGLYLYWQDRGRGMLPGRYNVHYAAWELEHLPAAWMPAMNALHEVWAISAFVQQAFAASASIPVLNMGALVTTYATGAHGRAFFGLPEGAFLFLCAFDLSSLAARKNPEGAVDAFLSAFGGGRAAVGLVLKVNFVPGREEHLRQIARLKRLAERDSRIIVLGRVVSRAAMSDLIAACDAYVSLHRAEGFGFALAEAMWLGKPAIATGYSGNLEFMRQDNSCLVGYAPVPVAPGEYVYGEGQRWAEPDIAQAARYMRRLAEDAAWREHIAAAGQQTVREECSAQAVGRRMRRRLALLGLV